MKNKIAHIVSGHFLTKHVPDDFLEMNEEDQLDFIDEHIYQPFRCIGAEEVLSTILELSEELFNNVDFPKLRVVK